MNKPIDTSTGAYLSGTGVWTDNSDRAVKEDFVPVDGRAVLSRLADLPISTWTYKADDRSIRHIGPMAQDFQETFGVGEDSRHIASLDTGGVALAAAQGLFKMVKDKDAEIAELTKRVSELETLVAELAEQQKGATQ